MRKVTLEFTEKEARVFVRALDIAASYINSGEPYSGILGEKGLTSEEGLVLRQRLQDRKDAFRKKLGQSIQSIDWPPTDQDLIEYLAGALESQVT